MNVSTGISEDFTLNLPFRVEYETVDCVEPVEARELIGSGAFGNVYKGYVISGSNKDEKRAIKVLNPRAISVEDAGEFFKKEGDMDRIKKIPLHPNLVKYLGAGKTGSNGRDTAFISMVFIPGDSYQKILDRHAGRYPDKDKALPVLHGLVKGLLALHGNEIIHRDVKPSNGIDNNGTPVIVDLGIAKTIEEGGTMIGYRRPIGTPEYMAPEQMGYGDFAKFPISRKTDGWAWSIVAYQMLSGNLPFRGKSRDELMNIIAAYDPVSRNHIEFEPIPLSEYVRDLNPDINRIIMSMLKRDPGERMELPDVSAEFYRIANDIRTGRSSVVISRKPSPPAAPASGGTLIGEGAAAAGKSALDFDVELPEISPALDKSGMGLFSPGSGISAEALRITHVPVEEEQEEDEDAASKDALKKFGYALLWPFKFAIRHWKGVAAAAALAPAGYFGWNYSEPYRAQYFGKPLVLDFNDEADARKLPRPAGWVVDTKHGFYSGFSRMRYPHTFREAEIRFDENTVVDMGNYRIEAKDGTVTLYDGSKDVRTVRFSSRPGNSLRLIYENESFSVYINGNSATLGGTPPRSLELGGGARLDRFTILE